MDDGPILLLKRALLLFWAAWLATLLAVELLPKDAGPRGGSSAGPGRGH
jgi:hypothetical protein